MSLNQKDLEQGLAAYKKSRKRELLRMMLLSALGIAAFLVIWQLVVQFKLVNVRNLPAPSKVVETILYKISNKNPDGNTLGTNILASLQGALSGFILALVIGIPLGLFMGWFTPVDKFVRPVFELLRPVPPIAWIPVVVVFVGIDLKAKATIIFLSVFVPCVINSYTGIKLTKRTLINVAKTFGAGNFETFIKVGIPSAIQNLLNVTGMTVLNNFTSSFGANAVACAPPWAAHGPPWWRRRCWRPRPDWGTCYRWAGTWQEPMWWWPAW